MSSLRIGQGYDSHQLVVNRKLVLGGVAIEDARLGALGHSDGDCLLHALIDALLGAMALGDIGQWFPDNDPALAGISSLELLKRVLADRRLPEFDILNIDATLMLDKPKLSPHRVSLIASLAQALGIPPDRINIKAKTWEGFEHARPLVASSVTLLLELG